VPTRGHQEDGAELFIVMHGEDKRQQAKLQQERFSQGIRRSFLPMRTARQQRKLPCKAVLSPSLEVFKIQADTALVWPLSWPCFGQRFEVETSKVQPELFCDAAKVKGPVNHSKVSS